jgi:glycosyltransferase involved in cell wall biosynthesis
MQAHEPVATCGTILALFPFLVKGNLALEVLREMRCRNLDITLMFCAQAAYYVPDPAEDFARDDRLLDFTKVQISQEFDAIEQPIRKRDVRLILQIGAAPMYRYLPFVKEKLRGITVVDLLYNDKGHVLQHFLFEPAIDGVIVESEYMRKYVESCSAKANPNVRIVKSGVSLESFAPSPETGAREGLKLGYLGRMSDEKNPLGFIRLAEQIYAAFPDTIFLMSGSGHLATDVRERIRTSVACDAFRYNGYNEDIKILLRQLDALVVPSIIDGRPNVIMEANACGVPVIATPVGGIPEMIEVGVNGYLFPPSPVEPILEVLSRWHNDRQSLAGIKRSSRKFAEQFFDRRGMLDNYEQVFREFLSFSGG